MCNLVYLKDTKECFVKIPVLDPTIKIRMLYDYIITHSLWLNNAKWFLKKTIQAILKIVVVWLAMN